MPSRKLALRIAADSLDKDFYVLEETLRLADRPAAMQCVKECSKKLNLLVTQVSGAYKEDYKFSHRVIDKTTEEIVSKLKQLSHVFECESLPKYVESIGHIVISIENMVAPPVSPSL